MKHLFLNRHAKSSWTYPTLKDFDRPLNQRGIEDAPWMGSRLADRNEKIELIISSPAKRAIETAILIATEIGYPIAKIVQNTEIYHASVPELLKIINSLDDALSKVVLFGHNPGFTDLCDYLSGSGILNIPTCGLCKISFRVHSWKEISAHTGIMDYFDYPKNDAIP